MSAFMVSKKHIDAIVAVAFYGPSEHRRSRWCAPYFHDLKLERYQLNELGDMLVKENLSSIHTRYPDTITDPEATPGPIDNYWLAAYQFEEVKPRPNSIQALKLLSCYEYQSCEHKEWASSDAREYCEQLRHSLINCLPGYEDAPWEWGEVAA